MTLSHEIIEQVAAWCFTAPELASERESAWRHFFGEDDPRPVKYWAGAEERVSRERRFLGWFMLDYTLPGGERPAELAARTLYGGNTRADLLKAFSGARYLFAVATGVGRRSVYLEVEGESFEVRYPAWISHLSRNQAVVAYLVPVGRGCWLPAPGWLVWPISIGPGMRASLKTFQTDAVSMEQNLQRRVDTEEKPKPRPARDDTLDAAVARMDAWAREKGHAKLAMSVNEWRTLVQKYISLRDTRGFTNEVLEKLKGFAAGSEPDIDELNEMLGLAMNIWNNTPQPDRGGLSALQLAEIYTKSKSKGQTSGGTGTTRKGKRR